MDIFNQFDDAQQDITQKLEDLNPLQDFFGGEGDEQ